MEDFWKSDIYFAVGRATVVPPTLTYLSVVSRDSVRITLTLAVLNNMEVKTSEIQNVYLTAPCS